MACAGRRQRAGGGEFRGRPSRPKQRALVLTLLRWASLSGVRSASPDGRSPLGVSESADTDEKGVCDSNRKGMLVLSLAILSTDTGGGGRGSLLTPACGGWTGPKRRPDIYHWIFSEFWSLPYSLRPPPSPGCACEYVWVRGMTRTIQHRPAACF